MYSLFLIFTQHHLIQVERAISTFKLDPKKTIIVLIVYSINNDSYLWIKNLMGYFDVRIFHNTRPRELLFNRSNINQYIDYLKSVSNIGISKMFSSLYYVAESKIANKIIKPSTFYVMDEGNASFSFVVNFFSIKNFILSFIYGYSLQEPSKITYFSQYSIPIKNSFDKLVIYKFNMIKNDLDVDEKNVYVLGSKIYEAGVLRNIQYYFDVLKRIYLSHSQVNLFYYPHRQESPQNLTKIGEIGYKVLDNCEPFEFLFPKLNPCPYKVISFASPILDTLSKQYSAIPKFVILRPNNNEFAQCHRETYKLIYDDYSKNERLSLLDV